MVLAPVEMMISGFKKRIVAGKVRLEGGNSDRVKDTKDESKSNSGDNCDQELVLAHHNGSFLFGFRVHFSPPFFGSGLISTR